MFRRQAYPTNGHLPYIQLNKDTPRKAVVGAVEAELGPDVPQLDAREGRVSGHVPELDDEGVHAHVFAFQEQPRVHNCSQGDRFRQLPFLFPSRERKRDILPRKLHEHLVIGRQMRSNARVSGHVPELDDEGVFAFQEQPRVHNCTHFSYEQGTPVQHNTLRVSCPLSGDSGEETPTGLPRA